MRTSVALVRRAKSQVQGEVRYMKTAAAMADAGEVRILVEGIWNREELENAAEDPMEKVNSRVTRHHAFAHGLQEAKVLIAKTNETPLDPFDIISDRRSVTALCLIYSSMVSHVI